MSNFRTPFRTPIARTPPAMAYTPSSLACTVHKPAGWTLMGRHVTEGRCQGNTTGTDKAALSIEASRNSQTACRQEAALTVQPDDQTGTKQSHSTNKCVQHSQTTAMNAGSRQFDSCQHLARICNQATMARYTQRHWGCMFTLRSASNPSLAARV